MFIGHFAIGLAAKRYAPDTSLAYLLLAPMLLDLLWPVFVLLGVEHFRIIPGANPLLRLSFDSYPWSHSLLLTLLWAYLFAAFFRHRGGSPRSAWVLSIGVASHWVLDWVSHRPDLPLFPGGPLTGLGLWNSVAGTVATESLLLAVGAWLYFGATRPKDRIGAIAPWGLLAFLALVYAESLVTAPPPPGSERLIAIIALVAVGLVPLAGWIDQHREARSAS